VSTKLPFWYPASVQCTCVLLVLARGSIVQEINECGHDPHNKPTIFDMSEAALLQLGRRAEAERRAEKAGEVGAVLPRGEGSAVRPSIFVRKHTHFFFCRD
jgi:hypothetical protein